jgi:S1-C subfamily serine protease
MHLRPIFLFLALTMALPALAQQATYYRISSGTGFVINNEGNVVTNAHVVKGCQSISILTAKGEEQAGLVAADTEMDLAVLKTPYISPSIAPLRWNISDLRVGDDVIVMGYPGEQGASGHYQFKKTKLVSLKGPAGEEKWIQLASVAAKGNSGGPVLDTSGNVIAVISGMAMTYRVNPDGGLSEKAVGRSDVAIPLAALEDFLHEHAIHSYASASGLVAYSDGALRDNARNFIVPVRCIQDVESR